MTSPNDDYDDDYGDDYAAADVTSGGGAHAAPKPSEPVAVTNAVNVLVTALVGAGWFTIDNTVINAILTVVGAAIAVFTTMKARAKVTPIE